VTFYVFSELLDMHLRTLLQAGASPFNRKYNSTGSSGRGPGGRGGPRMSVAGERGRSTWSAQPPS